MNITKKTKSNIIIVLLLLIFGASAEEVRSHEASYEGMGDIELKDLECYTLVYKAKSMMNITETLDVELTQSQKNEYLIRAMNAMFEAVICYERHIREHHK